MAAIARMARSYGRVRVFPVIPLPYPGIASPFSFSHSGLNRRCA
ncbi:hypothetical protein PSEWESI4_01800 [Pseudomonas carbonaria]|uniref:Uncharacterized protein n=1 Tax=Zestomonas carbonaria TaxID=2762745 RepID=A0A7U7EN35_9GAMM|nr:hypothetical protein PSEWESI4_01800 [Pseudomonas carbonaria]